MNQFKKGNKAWYKYDGRDRVFVITEIKGNVAMLQSDTTANPKIKTEAYLADLRPHASCDITNIIGRPTCDINSNKN